MSITCFTAPSSPPRPARDRGGRSGAARPSGDPAPARTGGNGDDGDRDAEPVPPRPVPEGLAATR